MNGDPSISLSDHSVAILYQGDGAGGNVELLPVHNGANVYIRCSQFPCLLPTFTHATACNQWGFQERIIYLDRHNPRCTAPGAMQRWKAVSAPYDANDCPSASKDQPGTRGKIEYTCTTPETQGATSEHDTGCQPRGFEWLQWLDRHNVECGEGKVLTQWGVRLDSCAWDEMTIKYTCMETPITSTSGARLARPLDPLAPHVRARVLGPSLCGPTVPARRANDGLQRNG